jgi:hypothetical protein
MPIAEQVHVNQSLSKALKSKCAIPHAVKTPIARKDRSAASPHKLGRQNAVALHPAPKKPKLVKVAIPTRLSMTAIAQTPYVAH